MTITIELPDDLAARLAAAGIPAEDASRYAVATLLEVAERAKTDADEVRAWWDSLTSDEQEEEKAKTRESLAAADAGRSSPAAEVYARIRAKRYRLLTARIENRKSEIENPDA
jgi:predicted transcriptional regulator